MIVVEVGRNGPAFQQAQLLNVPHLLVDIPLILDLCLNRQPLFSAQGQALFLENAVEVLDRYFRSLQNLLQRGPRFQLELLLQLLGKWRILF